MTTRMVGVFMRFTGLRANTVLQIEREDLDLAQQELHVRDVVDKNEYARVVPLAEALLVEAGAWIELTRHGWIFSKRRHSRRNREKPKKLPTVSYRRAWEIATEAGEVPLHVWHPRGRKNGRPLHAIRAAFDAYLIEEGVPADVVDFLVGRNEPDVRARHYGREMMVEARRAVNLIPPIDWGELVDNVFPLVGSCRGG
ncbi:MAG: site-specific integrase [Proteobacteria bacterium]|nr:site-specific integrase [Pseudomonadota bacterium]